MTRAPATGRRLRVAHVITDAGPHPYFRLLANHVDRERLELTVGCLGPAGPLQGEMESAGVETFALGAGSRRAYPAALARFARMLRARRTDVVQTHLVDASLLGLTAARLARVPLAIHTAHHSHELPFHGRRLVAAERLCAGPLSGRIIAPSRSVAETLVELAGARREKIAVIHHGFELDRFDPGRAERDRVRQELGLGEAVVLGAIGRSFRLKNHEGLIRAFAALAGDFPEARLLIAGPGDWSGVAGLAAELAVENRVVLVGPRDDVPDLLAAFDVFVHPAVAESFGMVIIEAMAMARPVVSTRVGIAPDAIEDGVSGVLAQGADPGALAQAIRRALLRRDDWRAIGIAARKRSEAFPIRGMIAAYEALYYTARGLAR